METLSYKEINNILRDNLIRIGDLVNFDGPDLTLYQDASSQDLYLFDHVDNSNEANRWLVYKADASYLLDFMHKKINHLTLFENSHQKGYPFLVTDIVGKMGMINSNLIELNSVPQNYFPSQESLFDPADCPALGKIQSFLTNITMLQNRVYKREIRSISHDRFHHVEVKYKSLLKKHDEELLRHIPLIAA